MLLLVILRVRVKRGVLAYKAMYMIVKTMPVKTPYIMHVLKAAISLLLIAIMIKAQSGKLHASSSKQLAISLLQLPP